jgi:RHS repeat-associated protein
MNARYQSPNYGIFISTDEVTDSLGQDKQFTQKYLHNPQGLNPYSYTQNDPVNKWDPDGRFNIKTGEVEKGDTLNDITKRLNIHFNMNNTTPLTAQKLASVNGIQDINKIEVGQKVILPKTNLELRFNNEYKILSVMDSNHHSFFNDLWWSGVSGKEGKYNSINTGKWRTVDVNSIQSWDDVGLLNKFASTFVNPPYQLLTGNKVGRFPGGLYSWGSQRTELIRDGETEGSGFYIHGGYVPGSAGCIDLTNQNDSFHKWFKSNQAALDLVVE